MGVCTPIRCGCSPPRCPASRPWSLLAPPCTWTPSGTHMWAQRTFKVVSCGQTKMEVGPLSASPGENPTSSKSSPRSLSPGWNGSTGAQKPGPGMPSGPGVRFHVETVRPVGTAESWEASAARPHRTAVPYAAKWKNKVYEALPKPLKNEVRARRERPSTRARREEHGFAPVLLRPIR